MATEPAAESAAPRPVECSVTVEATPETVFPFFTDPSKIVAWMGERATLSPEPGGLYRVELPEYTIRGEFVAVEAPKRVVFTWGWEHEDTLVRPGSSTVEVELEPVAAGTRVLLRHHKLAGEAAEQHAVGWSHYLERLRISGAGGDPGPDGGPIPDTERGTV